MMMMIVATAVDLLGDEIFHFFVFYKYHFDNKKGVKYCRCEDQSTSTEDSVRDVGSIALDIDDL